MINILLDALIAKKPSIKPRKIWLPLVISIVFAIIIIALDFWILTQPHWIPLLIMVVIIVIFIVITAIFEKKRIHLWSDKFKDYNELIDSIKDILSEDFTYPSALNADEICSWYSKEKINYLIIEGEKWMENQLKQREQFSGLFKIVIPIIAFVSGNVVDDYASNEIISAGVIGILAVAIVFMLYKLDEELTKIIYKSSSINEMQNLIDLLNNLLARDFSPEQNI